MFQPKNRIQYFLLRLQFHNFNPSVVFRKNYFSIAQKLHLCDCKKIINFNYLWNQ